MNWGAVQSYLEFPNQIIAILCPRSPLAPLSVVWHCWPWQPWRRLTRGAGLRRSAWHWCSACREAWPIRCRPWNNTKLGPSALVVEELSEISNMKVSTNYPFLSDLPFWTIHWNIKHVWSGGFPKSWGYPHSWMVQRENPKQKWMMTGDWWYPHLRNPQDFENGIVYDLGVSSSRNTQYLGYPLTVTFNVIWWVVWNSFYFSIYWVSNHPNWRTHFFRGVGASSQSWDFW